MITHFKIYGERCSGTNYIEQLMINNFEIELTERYGNKHFFKFREFDTFENNVLFIGIVRNVYDWINSLWRCKFHLPIEHKKDLSKFLNNEFYSVNERNENKEIIDDRFIYKNARRYHNIFELRKTKIKFLTEELPRFVSYYTFIKYEDLVNDFENTMIKLQQKFDLKIKSDNFPINVYNYKKTKQKFVPKDRNSYEIKLNDITRNKHFDINLERKLGYKL